VYVGIDWSGEQWRYREGDSLKTLGAPEALKDAMEGRLQVPSGGALPGEALTRVSVPSGSLAAASVCCPEGNLAGCQLTDLASRCYRRNESKTEA
jgi:hypothetical protein